MNETTRANVSELIRALARGGANDPEIASRMGLPVHTVRRIRREDGTPAGERRWLPKRDREGTTAMSEFAFAPYAMAARGRFFATRALAAGIRADAEAGAPVGTVRLDFTGVEMLTGGFADELIAGLSVGGRRVEIIGANEDIEETVRFALSRRPGPGEVVFRA